MSFSRAFQWYNSHLDPIWPDGTFKWFLDNRCSLIHIVSFHLEHSLYYTDKKENQIFLIYKEIQNEAVAKSYMTNGLLIYIGIYLRISLYIRKLFLNPLPLQLLHSEFPKFSFLFISVLSLMLYCEHNHAEKNYHETW